MFAAIRSLPGSSGISSIVTLGVLTEKEVAYIANDLTGALGAAETGTLFKNPQVVTWHWLCQAVAGAVQFGLLGLQCLLLEGCFGGLQGLRRRMRSVLVLQGIS